MHRTKKVNEQLDSRGHDSLAKDRAKWGTKRKAKDDATDTIDASSPPKRSSRLGENFTQDESADPDNEEMSIGSSKEEDVASEDEVSKATLAGEIFA
ncbi:hypothetical protein LTR17_000076 [Elasticomyces elasticus]|nr:hypothetical protein LTR17_000076 [Elasticomyces elasticus]